MATSITTIQANDLQSVSRTDINNNFDSLNTNKIETDVIDSDTTLAANSNAKIPTQRAVKAYVDAGGNVNASETQKGIVEEATDAEVTAGTAVGATGAKLFITPAKLATRFSSGVFKFGGNGSDGALAVSSGTTDIDLGGERIVVKNYTSVSITGTGSVTFSNPHTNGTIIIIKSQGAVILTSSSAPMLSAAGCGASGATSAGDSNSGGTGTSGTVATGYWITNGGNGGTNGGGGTTGTAITHTIAYSASTAVDRIVLSKYPNLFVGSGGGSGAAIRIAGGNGLGCTSGSGGRGGGALVIECAGALNFTQTNGISVAGLAGGNGSGTGNRCSAGGGGGGAGGILLCLYNSLTANTGTVNVSGGTGGSGYFNESGGDIATNTGSGGGGGSNYIQGTNGQTTSNQADSGGNGASGISIVLSNTEFA